MGKIFKLAGALAGAIVVTSAPAAHAAPSSGTVGDPSWVNVANGVTYESCNDQPFDLKPLSAWAGQQAHAWGNVNGYYNYEAKLKVIGPDGTEASSWTVDRTADDYTTVGDDTGTFFLCTGPGAYLVQGSGYWCPVDDTPEANPGDCKTLAFERTFTMRAAKSVTTLRAATSRVVLHKKRTLRFASTVKVERSTGMYAAPNVKVVLQYFNGRRWVRGDYLEYTDSRGVASFTGHFAKKARPGKYRFRTVVVSDGDFYGASKSKEVVVRVVR